MGERVKKLKNPLWVQSPTVDLFFFSFGWILALVAFWIMDQTSLKVQSRNIILITILLFNFLHRHITFPLVYGDPEQFNLRKKSYIGYPIFFLLLTLIAIFYVTPPVLETNPLPQNIQMSRRYSQEVRIFDGKKTNTFKIRFSGREKNPEDIATTFNRQLKGNMGVTAEGGVLRFRLENPKANSSFYLRGSKKRQRLTDQLGLTGLTGKWFYSSRPLLVFLIVLTVLWTVYHTVMQKVGILRIYSRKAKYGKSWLDKSLLFSWLIFIMLLLGNSPQVREQARRYGGAAAKFMSELFKTLEVILPYAIGLTMIVVLYLTFLYLKEEISNRQKISWPRNYFIVSILLLYATFNYDFLVGYAVFGFSHAIEYLAFVYFYSGKKFKARPPDSSFMARVVRRQRLSMATYCVVLVSVFLIWRFVGKSALELYILGSSFLHFLYDGWIWKVRDPNVGKPLGIDYQETPQIQPA